MCSVNWTPKPSFLRRCYSDPHPGYWRPQGSRAPHALQDALTPQETQKQHLDDGLTPHALQDAFFMQPTVLVGLIAHLTGLSLQDDIATTARRLQQLKGCTKTAFDLL